MWSALLRYLWWRWTRGDRLARPERRQQVVQQLDRGVRTNGAALLEGFFPTVLESRRQVFAHPPRGVGVQAAHPWDLVS